MNTNKVELAIKYENINKFLNNVKSTFNFSILNNNTVFPVYTLFKSFNNDFYKFYIYIGGFKKNLYFLEYNKSNTHRFSDSLYESYYIFNNAEIYDNTFIRSDNIQCFSDKNKINFTLYKYLSAVEFENFLKDEYKEK